MTNYISHKLFTKAAVIIGCLFVLSCENDERTINAWTEKKIMVEEAREVSSFFSQNGQMRAHLKAPLMLRVLGDTIYVEFPKTMHIDFFDSTGKVESWLDARYGKYFESLGRVYLRDSVRVINIKGDTLSTPELWWDQGLKKIYTDKTVRISTRDKQIHGGRGFEAGQDMSWYTIKEPTGTILVGDEFSSQ